MEDGAICCHLQSKAACKLWKRLMSGRMNNTLLSRQQYYMQTNRKAIDKQKNKQSDAMREAIRRANHPESCWRVEVWAMGYHSVNETVRKPSWKQTTSIKNEQSAAILSAKRRAKCESRRRVEEWAIRWHLLSNTACKPLEKPLMRRWMRNPLLSRSKTEGKAWKPLTSRRMSNLLPFSEQYGA